MKNRKTGILLCIILLLLLAPSPIFAETQDIYVDDQYVATGDTSWNHHYEATNLHIPILATSKALGVPAKEKNGILIVENKSVIWASIGASKRDNDYYVPQGWVQETLGWRIHFSEENGKIRANISLPPESDKGTSTILINDIPLKTNLQPIIIEGRTYVPLRAIFEEVGAKVVYWEIPNEKPRIKIIHNATALDFWPESNVYGVHIGAIPQLASSALYYFQRTESAFIQNGYTYVPLRFPAELLGGTVHWEETTGQVTITGDLIGFSAPADAKLARDAFDYLDHVFPGSEIPSF